MIQVTMYKIQSKDKVTGSIYYLTNPYRSNRLDEFLFTSKNELDRYLEEFKHNFSTYSFEYSIIRITTEIWKELVEIPQPKFEWKECK